MNERLSARLAGLEPAGVVAFIGLNVVWLAAVAGAGAGWWWAGPTAVALYTLTLSRWLTRRDWQLALIMLTVGILVDSAFAASGMIRYASPLPSPWLAPYWILSLWIAFALSLRPAMSWLLQRTGLAMVGGAVFGPFSYWMAAEQWGAAEFGTGPAVWIPVLALCWATVMWVAVMLTRRPGSTPTPNPSPVQGHE